MTPEHHVVEGSVAPTPKAKASKPREKTRLGLREAKEPGSRPRGRRGGERTGEERFLKNQLLLPFPPEDA